MLASFWVICLFKSVFPDCILTVTIQYKTHTLHIIRHCLSTVRNDLVSPAVRLIIFPLVCPKLLSRFYPKCHRAHSSRSRCPARWGEQRDRAVCHLSPPDLTATDRNCWGTGRHGDLWSSPAGREERQTVMQRVIKWVNRSAVSRTKPLTGSCSSNNRLTTTMLMSVPIVPSLKRLETCKKVE